MREFLFQIILALIGAVIGVIAAILKPGPLKRLALILTIILLVTVIYWVGFEVGQRANANVDVSSPPHVSLISISYEINKINPRMIDLRTASSRGIPVEANQSLRLFDLWFSATADNPLSIVQAEIYSNDILLGSTPPKPLIAGQFKLDVIEIKNYANGNDSSSWIVQPDWKNLNVFLITYREGKVVDRNLLIIRLASNGTSGFVYPPNLSFVSVVYKINDGPETILDMRYAESKGLSAKPGDKLTLQEIWYDSNINCQDCTVHAEAIFADQQNSYDGSTYHGTKENIIVRAINQLSFEPISWTIPEGKRVLVLSLVRNDGTILDILILPIGLQG